jgi:formate hydrogenlyase transcriptional activator
MSENSHSEGTILLVDDTLKNLRLLSKILKKTNYQTNEAINGNTALMHLEHNIPDLILLDIMMPGMDGFELCQRIKSDSRIQHIPIIFISALGETEDKVKAFEFGGVDYITKPFQVEEVLVRVNTHLSNRRMQKSLKTAYDEIEIKVQSRTMELKQTNEELFKEVQTRKKIEQELQVLKDRLQDENSYLQEEIKTTLNFGEIIGESQKIKEVFKLIEQVAQLETTVLITGETGTGKELIARAIHTHSKRKDRPLVKVNCATLPTNLIESELFGHEKGAFTGADGRQTGRFELANDGIIFLDEIGELPLELQVKLLRVIQEGEFERLGSSKTIKVNIKIVAATNRKLDKLIEAGKFREDLFYRLNVFPIESPPLRDRKGDISLLVSYFLKKHNTKTGKNIIKIPQKVMGILQSYYWPGNIRELENIIERAVIISPGENLQIDDCFPLPSKKGNKSVVKTLDEMQIEHIISVLELAEGKIKGDLGAAKLLGIKPTTLLTRMEKLGIKIKKRVFSI